jgi:hypothetical protein
MTIKVVFFLTLRGFPQKNGKTKLRIRRQNHLFVFFSEKTIFLWRESRIAFGKKEIKIFFHVQPRRNMFVSVHHQ